MPSLGEGVTVTPLVVGTVRSTRNDTPTGVPAGPAGPTLPRLSVAVTETAWLPSASGVSAEVGTEPVRETVTAPPDGDIVIAVLPAPSMAQVAEATLPPPLSLAEATSASAVLPLVAPGVVLRLVTVGPVPSTVKLAAANGPQSPRSSLARTKSVCRPVAAADTSTEVESETLAAGPIGVPGPGSCEASSMTVS